MSTVSFAKTPGAGQSAPVTPLPEKAPDANAVVEANPENLPATQDAPAPSNSLGFYTGEDDAPEDDPRDGRPPRLNLVQGMSDAELKKIGSDGDFVFKKAIKLPQNFTAVMIGYRPKVWYEKLPKFKEGTPRIANSLAEVAAFGGVDEWKLSRENEDKKTGERFSKKPWFICHVTILLLIQRPEGADDGHFPAVTPEGVAYAPALFTVKSTSYGSFFVPLSQELRALFRGSFANRFITVSSKQATKNPSYYPVPKIGGETPASVRALAKKALS